MFAAKRVLYFTIILSLLPVMAGSEWPRWRGPDYNGSISAELPADLEAKLDWKTALGSGYSSVSIVGNRVITAYSDGTHDFMTALDSKSGKTLWAYKICETFKGRNGSTDGPLASPAVASNKVFGISGWGHFFALDLASGKEIWTLHLADDLGAEVPTFGFSSSPLVHEDLVILHVGAENGVVAAFDVNNGKKRWSFGSGKISYQSPEMASIDGNPNLLFAIEGNLYGLDPKTGKQLWQFEHEGDHAAIDPTPLSGNRIFLNHKYSESMMLKVIRKGDEYEISELWRSGDLAGSNGPAVYHDGFLYGYKRRIFVCVNAETGKRAWRSRSPGPGFLIRVGPFLAVQSSDNGTLHLVEATGEGYNEKATLKVFDHYSYNPPSYAGGRIYMRSMEQIAAVKVGAGLGVAMSHEVMPGVLPDSRFAAFVKRVEAAPQKQRTVMVDEYMANHRESPIIEGSLAHILFRGDAGDVALSGDFLKGVPETNMHRVAGTDFYYYSVEAAKGGMMSYGLILNYEEKIPDPLNPHKSMDGKRSIVSMPGWKQPDYLEEPKGKRGSLVESGISSKALDKKRKLQVYLPPGYDEGDQNYPVIYVHGTDSVSKQFGMPAMLDNLIASRRVEPVIVVFIGENPQGSWRDHGGNTTENYAKMVTEELIPYVDGKWRTRANADQRLIYGMDDNARSSFRIGLTRPDVFANIAGQSTYARSSFMENLEKQIPGASGKPIRIYMDWGLYEDLGPRAGFNIIDNNRKASSDLKKAGFQVIVNETPTGSGEPAWRARFGRMISEFFPIAEH